MGREHPSYAELADGDARVGCVWWRGVRAVA